MEFVDLSPETVITLRWVIDATNPASWPGQDAFVYKVGKRFLGYTAERAHLWTPDTSNKLLTLPDGKYTCRLTRQDGAGYATFHAYYVGYLFESVIKNAFGNRKPLAGTGKSPVFIFAKLDADSLVETLTPFKRPIIRLGTGSIEIAGATVDGGFGNACVFTGLIETDEVDNHFDILKGNDR